MKIKNLISLFICAVMLFGICYIPLYADAGQNDAIKGVDLSRWNGSVDFTKLKSRGVDFAILRCYSYWKEDPTFKSNYNGAVAAGVKVGAYNYMYATTEEAAKTEAEAALNVLDGRMLEYPYFLDIEDSSLTSLGKAQLTKLALIELKIFEEAGYNVGIYSSKSFLNSYLDVSQLDGYDLWIARWTYYSTKKTYRFEVQPSESSYKPVCSIWQFSDGGDGSYYGIGSARVDMNYSYVDYAENPSYSASTNPEDYTIPVGTLSFEANNDASSVRWVQAMLYNLGYRIAVCGKYTSYMKDIVRTFQSESRLPETGNVDSATLDALKNTFYEMAYTFTIKYKSSKNSLNVLDDTYPFFTSYTISNPGLEIAGFKLSGWNVKRASDGKWLADDGKWYNKSEAAGKLTVLPDGITIRLNGEFCNSFKKKETIVFYAVWEETHIPAATKFIGTDRYDVFNEKCAYADAVNIAQIREGMLAPLYDEKVLESISPLLTSGTYFIGASFDGSNLNWLDGTVSAPPEGSTINYSFVILTKTDNGYAFGSLKENKKAEGFIVLSRCKHENTVIKGNVNATCTSKGFSGDIYCKDCGALISKGKEIEKVAHIYGEVYALSKATTKEDGVKAKKCSVCGKEVTGTVPKISSIELRNKILTCTGDERYPKVKVINSDGKTVSSKYYTLSYYEKPKNPGVYYVTVKFGGLYGGEKALRFKIKPAKATALKAFDIKKTSLQLKWKNAAGANYYRVEKSVDGVNWTKIRTVSTLSLKVSKLEKGGKYRFRIKAYDKNKKYGSDYSTVLKTGTRTIAPKIKLTNTSNSVSVSWGKVSGAKSYIVYKSSTGAKWSKAGETGKSSFRITGLSKGKQIYIKVRAVNTYGKKSDFSSVKSLVVGMKTPKVGFVSNGKVSYSNGKYYITDSETNVKFLLVNKSYSLPSGYGPGGLTKDCKNAFDRLVAAARNDGITINALSTYRSYSYQKSLYQGYVNRYGRAYADRISAREGHSEHQTGLAIDCNSLSASFSNTPAGRWLRANCANYGFIIRYGYGKESSTGFTYEPWHIRYIGSAALAKKLTSSGLSIEEYYNINSKY